MELFVHYQERAVRSDGNPMAMLTDVIMPLAELEELYDEFQVENLLNAASHWDDNGVVYLNRNGFVVDYSHDGHSATEFALQHRIKLIVCNARIEDYRAETPVLGNVGREKTVA